MNNYYKISGDYCLNYLKIQNVLGGLHQGQKRQLPEISEESDKNDIQDENISPNAKLSRLVKPVSTYIVNAEGILESTLLPPAALKDVALPNGK